MHYCAYHKEDHPKDAFRVKKNGRLDSWCVEGRREYNRNYIKEKYAPIKAENEIKRTHKPTKKTCTKCKIDKPITDFSERKDRPGKLHARCIDCLRTERRIRNVAYIEENREKLTQWRKKYQSEHPRYNDQATRDRRARKKRIRSEKYKREIIREKDNGLCFFCKEPVDLELKYPHPESETLHHMHPISKMGSDSPSNVFISHHRCNARHKDKYDCVFKTDYEVRQITSQLARQIAVDKHYLHRPQNVSFAWGLFKRGSTFPQGIVSFGSPGSYRISKSVCPPDHLRLVLELNRLFIEEGVPFGAASWLISRAMKELPPYIVITYADSGIEDSRDLSRPHNHDGTIYRALNFHFAGISPASKEYRLPNSSRCVRKNTPGAILYENAPKYRYWTVTGTKRDKRLLSNLCQWPSI